MPESFYHNFRHECAVPNGNSFFLDDDWLTTKDYDIELHEHFPVKKSEITIEISENLIYVLPFIFNELGNRITKAKYILELEEDWDDEGGKPYSEQTFKQAIDFIIEYTQWAWNDLNILISPPKIFHGPNQSIDLLWSESSYELLINIPPYPKKISRFYGDNKKNTRIEGQFNIKDYGQGVFLCLLANEQKVS